MRTARLAAYGKLPACGDFVRISADTELRRLVDGAAGALLRTFEAAASRRETFAAAAPAIRIACRQPQGLSVWFSSSDAVGRPYPLVIEYRLETGNALDPVDLLALSLRLAGPCVHAVLQQPEADLGSLQKILDELPRHCDPDLEATQLSQGLQQSTLAELWRSSGLPPARRDAALQAIATSAGQAPALLHWSPTPSPTHMLFWLLLWLRLQGQPPASLYLQAATATSNSGFGICPRPEDDRLLAAALWPGIVPPGTAQRRLAPLQDELPPAAARQPLAEAASLADLLHDLLAARPLLPRKVSP